MLSRKAIELLRLASRIQSGRGKLEDHYADVLDHVFALKPYWPQLIDDRTPQLLVSTAGGPLRYVAEDPECASRLAQELELMAARAFDRIRGKTTSAPQIITAAVAQDIYDVSPDTLSKHVRSGDLTDHRPTDHAKNAHLQLDEAEIASRWRKHK